MKLKDKKISIWRYTEERNKNGFPAEMYIRIHEGKLWAHYRQASGEEYNAAMTSHYQEDAIFTINWREDIDPRTDVILYRGRIYDINRIDDYEGYRTELRISARYNKGLTFDQFEGIEDT